MWRQRKVVESLSLFIVDDLHLLGGNKSPIMEAFISRMRYLIVQLSGYDGSKCSIRMIGPGSTIAKPKRPGSGWN
jgi:pre-mRNA-splicing helicase BRR2